MITKEIKKMLLEILPLAGIFILGIFVGHIIFPDVIKMDAMANWNMVNEKMPDGKEEVSVRLTMVLNRRRPGEVKDIWRQIEDQMGEEVSSFKSRKMMGEIIKSDFPDIGMTTIMRVYK